MVVLEIGFYRERGEDFSLSIVIETEYGAVIELWGEYIQDKSLTDALDKLLKDGCSILLMVRDRDIRDVRIIAQDVMVSNFFVDKEDFKRFVLGILKKFLGDGIMLSIELVSDYSHWRAYSLARKAYYLKGNYPPRIPP